MPKKALLIGGTLHQTRMVHQIGRELGRQAGRETECYYTPAYAGRLVNWFADHTPLLKRTLLAGQAKRRSLEYLEEHDLPVDDRGRCHDYDLAVTTQDVMLPKNLDGARLVLVQEGMTDPEDWRYRLAKLGLVPRFFANTSVVGLSGAYDLFCVASDGYRELFVGKGADPSKIRVTGIPLFDHCAAYRENDFPHRGYVLVATSCLRETLKWEDRKAFIRRAVEIAGGRPLIFKLHPNEKQDRAVREIRRWAPEDARIYRNRDIRPMIANCEALVTRYSSVVWFAQALGKEIHSDLDAETLERLCPVQNGGSSARRIAELSLELVAEGAGRVPERAGAPNPAAGPGGDGPSGEGRSRVSPRT